MDNSVSGEKAQEAQEMPKVPKRGIVGWAMFDWAAQPMFTVVTTFVFGPYLVNKVAENPDIGQAQWAFAAGFAGLVIAILSPILGSIADASGRRKPWIAFFASIKILSLFMLWYALPGDSSNIYWILFFFSLATVAAEFSIVFNDSMLPSLVSNKNMGLVSNWAWGLGYLGGMIVLILILGFMAASPETGKTLLGGLPLFDLDPQKNEADRASAPISALWYLVFLLPMFLFTPDRGKRYPMGQAIKSGMAGLKSTMQKVLKNKGLRNFYLARMIYQDGVNGMLLLGGSFAAGVFGWTIIELGAYGIILNVAAIFSCAIAGFVDQKIGSKTIIIICLILLIIANIGIASTTASSTLFGLELSTADNGGLFATMAEKAYILYGLLVGLAFGPIQASSRSYLARSIPENEAGSYFGLYAFIGRATAFMAPFMVAGITAYFTSARVGMASLILFFVVGFIILLFTPYPANKKTT